MSREPLRPTNAPLAVALTLLLLVLAAAAAWGVERSAVLAVPAQAAQAQYVPVAGILPPPEPGRQPPPGTTPPPGSPPTPQPDLSGNLPVDASGGNLPAGATSPPPSSPPAPGPGTGAGLEPTGTPVSIVELPFTGLALAPVLFGGVVLLVTGLLLRRRLPSA